MQRCKIVTRTRISTGSNRAAALTLSDIHNTASYKASSVGVSVGAGASKGASAGLGSDKGSASSTTQAAISGIAGPSTGSGQAGAARTGDAQSGIGRIFDADKVQRDISAQVQITQEFGKQASRAVGDYAAQKLKEAQKTGDPAGIDAWKEGGTNRVALHALVGGLTGGVAGALGSGAASAAAPVIDQLQGQLKTALKDAGLGDSAASVIASLSAGATAATVGAVASGGSVAGAATAFNADMNNRQLHPTEAALIKANAKEYAKQRGISVDRAEAELTQQAERNNDSAHAERLGADDPQAQAFLKTLGAGQNMVDGLTGQTYQLFSADQATRDNHAEFGQYAKTSPQVQQLLDKAYTSAYIPKDGQTIAGVNGSNAGALTGSDLALNDAARDYGNMRQQPAVVQWAVLGELRQERQTNLQNQLALAQELQQLNSKGDTSPAAAQRRGEILQQFTQLDAENQTLRQASVVQIGAMGSAGLLKPVDQREWGEGAGSAIGSAGLNLKGLSTASIAGKVGMLREAVKDTQAATAAAKAEAQAVAKAGVEVNARVDDAQQYDHFRKTDSTRPGGEWDFQSQAPNGGAVSGTQVTVTIKPGEVLDRYGDRGGSYMSPAATPYEGRALPPGTQASSYEKYEVLKPFSVDKEQIAPAFDQPGGGVQLRASIPEVENRYANINDLIQHGYLKDPKK